MEPPTTPNIASAETTMSKLEKLLSSQSEKMSDHLGNEDCQALAGLVAFWMSYASVLAGRLMELESKRV